MRYEHVVTSSEIRRKVTPSFTRELVEYVVYFVAVFTVVAVTYLFIRSSVFDVIGISGRSMFPTYDDRDAIYIDQLTPKFGDYRRGDVVVMVAPEDANGKRSLYIKRVIGLPGEQVILENGSVFIKNNEFPNEVMIDERDYLDVNVKTFRRVISDGSRFESTVLQDDEYYVLGDNRTGSTDSRFFGAVDKRDILGREVYRIIPQEKAGTFVPPTYNIPG